MEQSSTGEQTSHQLEKNHSQNTNELEEIESNSPNLQKYSRDPDLAIILGCNQNEVAVCLNQNNTEYVESDFEEVPDDIILTDVLYANHSDVQNSPERVISNSFNKIDLSPSMNDAWTKTKDESSRFSDEIIRLSEFFDENPSEKYDYDFLPDKAADVSAEESTETPRNISETSLDSKMDPEVIRDHDTSCSNSHDESLKIMKNNNRDSSDYSDVEELLNDQFNISSNSPIIQRPKAKVIKKKYKKIYFKSKVGSSPSLPVISSDSENDQDLNKIEEKKPKGVLINSKKGELIEIDSDDLNELDLDSGIDKDCEADSQNNDLFDEEEDLESILDVKNLNQKGKNAIGPKRQWMEYSDAGGKHYEKDHYCKYCVKKVSRIDRHLVSHHSDKPEIKELDLYDPKTVEGREERKKMLDKIRNEFDEIYNKNRKVNPSGEVIPKRRPSRKRKCISKNEQDEPQFKKVKSVQVRLICRFCKAYFSAQNLHHHQAAMHNTNTSKRHRDVKSGARVEMAQFHALATEELRTHVLSRLKNDLEGKVASKEIMIILYGNKYMDKFDPLTQSDMIKYHMRLLAKLLISVNKLSKSISTYEKMFDPHNWPVVLRAIFECCKHKEETKTLDNAYNGETIPTLLRKLFVIARAYYIIKYSSDNQTLFKDRTSKLELFTKLFDDEIEKVSSRARRSRKAIAKNQNEEYFPTLDDLTTFQEFLDKKLDQLLADIKEKGTINRELYIRLQEILIIKIQAFNARRGGETDRILLSDYEKARKTKPESDFYKMLNLDDKIQSTKFVRIDAQGKKEDGVGTFYLSRKVDKAMSLLVESRVEVGISPKNKFFFAKVGLDEKSRQTSIDAYQIMVKLTAECNNSYKEIPTYKLIRGTNIRKLASTLLQHCPEGYYSLDIMTRHLGHTEKTHKAYYRKKVDSTDCKVTRFLEKFSSKKGIEEAETTQKNEESERSLEDIQTDSPGTSHGTKSCNKNETTQYKNKGKTSIRWSAEDKKAFKQAFNFYLQLRKVPSAKEIQYAMDQNDLLKKRGEKKIRARFSNIYKKDN